MHKDIEDDNRGKRSKTLSEVKPVRRRNEVRICRVFWDKFHAEGSSFSAETARPCIWVTILSDEWKITLTEKLPESIELSKLISHGARMSGEFNSRKDSYSTKFNWRPQIFVKLSFWKFCDSKLSGLRSFDKLAIIHWVENRLWVYETPIFEVIFVTVTEGSYVVTNDTQGPWKYSYHLK